MTLSVDCADATLLPALAAQPDHIRYDRGTPMDAQAITALYRQHDEVSLCDWQDLEVMREILTRETTIAHIAVDSRFGLVGAVIGGVLGTRATINHLAVSAPFRAQGIGRELVRHFCGDVTGLSIRRLFVFVDNDNMSARRFWGRLNFARIGGEMTLERDL